MQTFLPYPDIIKSVQCLDNKRLGKQRVEAYQILRVITGLSIGWQHHPAVKMWQGYSLCLTIYMNCCIQEWIKRGFKNTMFLCNIVYEPGLNFCEYGFYSGSLIYPWWFGNKDFHDSHKSNLLRKNPKWYSQFNWDVPDNISYWWPNKNEMDKS